MSSAAAHVTAAADAAFADFRAALDRGDDRLPLPGHGRTAERFAALTRAGAHDLAFAKWFESHADALAILAELGAEPPSGATLAVWAAEGPGGRLQLEGGTLTGRKLWCSGATRLSHALVTAWQGAEGPYLALVPLRHAGVTVHAEGFAPYGMAAAQTADVDFDHVPCQPIGPRGAYLDRPGFWQGGAGVAAVWHGAACTIANALHAACRRPDPGELRLAALGRVEAALSRARHTLDACATWIDAHPQADASAWARRTRLVVEESVETVLAQVERTLGPAPLMRDAAHARRVADLRTFVRQSHADRDYAALGAACAATEAPPWR